MISFANSLEPGQAQHNAGPDLDSDWHSGGIPEKIFWKGWFQKKISRRQKKHENFSSGKELKNKLQVPMVESSSSACTQYIAKDSQIFHAYKAFSDWADAQADMGLH